MRRSRSAHQNSPPPRYPRARWTTTGRVRARGRRRARPGRGGLGLGVLRGRPEPGQGPAGAAARRARGQRIGLMFSSQDHDLDAEDEARYGRAWMDVGSGPGACSADPARFGSTGSWCSTATASAGRAALPQSFSTRSSLRRAPRRRLTSDGRPLLSRTWRGRRRARRPALLPGARTPATSTSDTHWPRLTVPSAASRFRSRSAQRSCQAAAPRPRAAPMPGRRTPRRPARPRGPALRSPGPARPAPRCRGARPSGTDSRSGRPRLRGCATDHRVPSEAAPIRCSSAAARPKNGSAGADVGEEVRGATTRRSRTGLPPSCRWAGRVPSGSRLCSTVGRGRSRSARPAVWAPQPP